MEHWVFNDKYRGFSCNFRNCARKFAKFI